LFCAGGEPHDRKRHLASNEGSRRRTGLRGWSPLGYRHVMTGLDPDSAVERLADVLRQQDGVRLAYLFGSRARQQQRADSDFDIAVLLNETAAAADRGRPLRGLVAALGRVVAATLVDLVVLNDAPPLLRHRVLRDGILIMEQESEDRVRFARRTLRDYQDQQIRREWATRARIHRLTREANNGRSGDLLEKARGAARLLAEAARVS
jgi:predicted nucleotidyltransferase